MSKGPVRGRSRPMQWPEVEFWSRVRMCRPGIGVEPQGLWIRQTRVVDWALSEGSTVKTTLSVHSVLWQISIEQGLWTNIPYTLEIQGQQSRASLLSKINRAGHQLIKEGQILIGNDYCREEKSLFWAQIGLDLKGALNVWKRRWGAERGVSGGTISHGSKRCHKAGGGTMGDPSGFVKWCLRKLGSCPPTEAGSRGPVFQCWLEQTVHSLGRLEFFGQTL